MAYGSDTGLTAYLALSGRALPVGVTPAAARYWGSAYVDMFEVKYKGAALALPDSFPRDIYNPTPVAVEYAAYEAGLAHAEGVALFGGGGTSSGKVTRRKVDTLEIQYAESNSEGLQGYYEDNLFILPLAYRYLIPYMKVAGFVPAAVVVGRGGSCGC